MYEELGQVTLTTGEQVEAGVVVGPDVEWAERVRKFYTHKPDPWDWQIRQVLESNVGIGARFYLLHRRGMPFASIAISELSGVGWVSHVWTNPEDRQKGACSKLMGAQMKDLRSRQGQALLLDCVPGFESFAYGIYERFGFSSLEPGSARMAWYATSEDEFEAVYYRKGETEVQTLEWAHWPSSAALFLGDFPCAVRCAPLKLIGRLETEGPLLPIIRDEKRRQAAGEEPHALVLRNVASTAVVGFTAWDWHPLWEDTCLVDVFCHPNYWDEAGSLLTSLPLPEADRYVAYVDVDCTQKTELLLEQGFKQTAIFERRVPRDYAKQSFVDVALFETVSS